MRDRINCRMMYDLDVRASDVRDDYYGGKISWCRAMSLIQPLIGVVS